MDQDLLPPILGFLSDIGVPVREDAVPETTFLPGVCVRQGTLVFDRSRLAWPTDLLHEAGHIAVTPGAHRGALDGTLEDGELHAFGGEAEAIAWSFAATVHLGLPVSSLFHEGGYRGQSKGLALSYALGVYPGVHGLAQGGLTLLASQAEARQAAPYPNMLRWLRA